MDDTVSELKKITTPLPCPYDYLIKIILVGDSGVGKSSLFQRYTNDIFNKDYETTIGVDFRPQYLQFGEKTLRINIFDSAGQDRFRSITSNYFRGVHGILLVYDVTDRTTFANLKFWLEDIERNTNTFRPRIVLVGNKGDMLNPYTNFSSVSVEEGDKFAKELEIPFLITSAKRSEGVNDAFAILIKDIINTLPENILRKNTASLSIEPSRRKRFKPRCCN